MKASGGMEAVCWDILAEDSGKRVFEVTSLEAWLSLREGLLAVESSADLEFTMDGDLDSEIANGTCFAVERMVMRRGLLNNRRICKDVVFQT
ncbi:hypothetical protein LTR09_003518 [Extremus antarcticus]|uniref:Uncharacterized protein n=1 Tax=Extremus antarcticus TaxID=702011 RepID=A0AAJ0GE26_9PEZI|nr:hypothetical protein LTR09_003518 [Extremus antarcticus]